MMSGSSDGGAGAAGIGDSGGGTGMAGNDGVFTVPSGLKTYVCPKSPNSMYLTVELPSRKI